MQVSKTWLQTFFNQSLDQIDIENILTMAGLEVDEVRSFDNLSDLVVVAEVVSVEKHPDADRLNVCQVNAGQSEHLQIVCGAPNVRAGLMVPCALVGAKLADFEIKKAKLRGVDSHGMLCSAKEIGLSQEADGLLELNQDMMVGTTIKQALSLDDTVYTLSLTPNRADCLSILGVAREVASLSKIPMKTQIPPAVTSKGKCEQKIEINDQASCPRYCGRQIRGVNNNQKLPDFIIQSLERSGIGSISPIVDITNYVLMELGQPLHAFDQHKLQGQIQVRSANKKEKITLLNEQEVELSDKDLVIADEKGPIALAGIMGGLDSAIDQTTTDVFLESAFFNPEVIAGRARSFGLSTDSSHRFERGVDYANTAHALDRATELIIEYCGGVASDLIDVQSNLPTRDTITLNASKVSKVLGLSLDEKIIENAIKSLQMTYKQTKPGIFEVTPPSYRFDLKIEADLIEEVIRLYGYDNIESILPDQKAEMLELPDSQIDINETKNKMANLGYTEVVTYSFIDKDLEQQLHENKNLIELDNPIASQMNVMRSKLWASHLEVLNYNINRGQSQVRIFEIAPTYHKQNNTIFEQTMVSGLAYGSSMPEQWKSKNEKNNLFNIKGDIEIISSNLLGYEMPSKGVPGALHPGQTALIKLNGEAVGWLGHLHPLWQQKYDLTEPTFIFEFRLDALQKRGLNDIELPSKLIPVRRDIAVIVDQEVPVQDMIRAVNGAKIGRVIEFTPFDVYQGQGIDKNKKSIAFLILMQDTYKTLEDSDVTKIVDQVLEILQSKFSATLR